jgi:hypothetical protein
MFRIIERTEKRKEKKSETVLRSPCVQGIYSKAWTHTHRDGGEYEGWKRERDEEEERVCASMVTIVTD